jgi:N6-adenosine-specific RNA methylase IME4
MKRDFHPLSEIFPLMEGEPFDDLVADIQAHGVREPIWLYEKQILDGRNRYLASMVAGVDCPVRDYAGDDPAAFIVSLNLKRRHLDEGQRAMVAAKLATMRQGARTDLSPIGEMSQQQAADLLNVGKRSVERAQVVRDQGAPELVAAVESGKVSVLAAADVATKPTEEQREIVARGEKEILEAAKAIRAEKFERRRAERILENDKVRERNEALPLSERHYSVIYADPPWQYDMRCGEGIDRAVENHFPTLPLDEIKALPVADLAADHCALFLWTPPPLVKQAIEVIEAWGFEYTTFAFVWVKQTKDEERFATGMGNYTRANAELVLLGTKGSPVRLNADVHQIILAPRMEHSRKPEEAAERIMRLVPGPYIELFARRLREGWDVWGNEVSGVAFDLLAGNQR